MHKTYIESVRKEIRRLGGDDSKLSDDKLNELGASHGVPHPVLAFDPAHPVFGALGDGSIIKWIVAHWDIIQAVARVAMMILPLL